MRFYTAAAAFLSVSAGLVAAQDTTTAATSQTTSSSSSGYSCAAQYIVDACLQSTQPQLKACASTDWDCLCDQSTNVLTCYNNCPGHPDQFGAQQTKESYCNAAKAYGSSRSTSSSTATSSASEASTIVAVASTTSSGSNADSTSTSTSTRSSSASTSTSSKNAAAGMTVESGSLVAAVLMGLGAML